MIQRMLILRTWGKKIHNRYERNAKLTASTQKQVPTISGRSSRRGIKLSGDRGQRKKKTEEKSATGHKRGRRRRGGKKSWVKKCLRANARGTAWDEKKKEQIWIRKTAKVPEGGYTKVL